MAVKKIIQLFKVWRKRSASVYLDMGIHPFRQFVQIVMWVLRGFSVQEYYIYPLYGVDPGPVIRHREYDRLQKKLNPSITGVIPVDKWVQSLIWKATNISHAQVTGFIKGNKGLLGGKLYGGLESELRTFIYKQNLPLIIKPIDGSNGAGFDILEEFNETTNELHLHSNGVLSFSDFTRKLSSEPGGMLFQVKIIQHSKIAEIFPTSVNTVRIVTLIDSDGKCGVTQAMMKFGGGNNIIDNDLEEGLLALINLETGKMEKALKRFGGKQYDVHPKTGVTIQGVSVPHWKEAMALAIKAHQIIPYPKHLGWDVAITESGPMILEMNSYLSVAVNQKINNYSPMKLLGH